MTRQNRQEDRTPLLAAFTRTSPPPHPGRGGARRVAVRGGALAAFGPAVNTVSAGASRSAERLEPDAGGWKTWILESGSELRPAAPPNGATTRAELETLRSLTAE